MATLWGEMTGTKSGEHSMSSMKREQVTRPRLIEIEGPRLHQPSSRHYPPTNDPLPPEMFQIDNVTLHTIRLIQHARKIRQIIQTIQQQQEAAKGSDIDITYPAVPPVPEFTGTTIKHPPLNPVPFLPRNVDGESDFVKGIGDSPPVIDDIGNRKLLRRSVAAMCAHAGYDSSSESVLETLTDITHEFYLQFTHHMRAAADNFALSGHSGFPDIMEQVYYEMGLGSVKDLHEFYQNRVLTYHQNMEQTCQQLLADYEKLKQPAIQKTPDTVPVIRIKEESSSEIQFPVLDEDDEVNEAEKLLQLEGLGGLEITVEHESTSGLMTEETKWSQNIKVENTDTKVDSLDAYDDPGSMKEHHPQSSPPGDMSDSMQDTGSASDIMSPPSITSRPSKPKKKKKS